MLSRTNVPLPSGRFSAPTHRLTTAHDSLESRFPEEEVWVYDDWLAGPEGILPNSIRLVSAFSNTVR